MEHLTKYNVTREPSPCHRRIGALLIILSIVITTFSACDFVQPKKYFPTEGIWFCKELGIQINFDGINDNFIKIGDEYIFCLSGSNPNSSILKTRCQDSNSSDYELGELVFSGEYVTSNSQSFSVRSRKDSQVYTFVRNDNFISTPATQYLFIDVFYYSIQKIHVDFRDVLYDEISDRIKQGAESCCGTELLSGTTLTYDLYCAQENRTSKEQLDFEDKVYLYAVITAFDEETVDLEKETHLFVFCLTYEGVQTSLYNEVHSASEGVSKFLPADAEKLGSFAMQTNGDKNTGDGLREPF